MGQNIISTAMCCTVHGTGSTSSNHPRPQRLPDVLTVAETFRLINTTRMLRYRVFFFTVYSLGLRLSEGLQLQVGETLMPRGGACTSAAGKAIRTVR